MNLRDIEDRSIRHVIFNYGQTFHVLIKGQEAAPIKGVLKRMMDVGSGRDGFGGGSSLYTLISLASILTPFESYAPGEITVIDETGRSFTMTQYDNRCVAEFGVSGAILQMFLVPENR